MPLTSIQQETSLYLSALEEEMESFFSRQQSLIQQISPETLPLLDSIRALSQGGKRLRALLAYWGYRGAGGQGSNPSIIKAGVAIELFQTAALIHDDIIDASDTRRGAPSVHRRFEADHRRLGYKTSPESYGISSAILAGDLCLSWSEMVFASIPQSTVGSQARYIFDLMRTEVMAGQYLDILGEVVAQQEPQEALERAQNVIRYKSAKYSCEQPLALGGALALNLPEGQENSLLAGYRAFALPLGEGFQLRDDQLGVFGQPEVTGKPAGDDLREGKRTVLTALTALAASQQQAQQLEEALGQPDLSLGQIQEIQKLMRDLGALDALEDMIEAKSQQALTALEALEIDPIVVQALKDIAHRALHRAA